MNANDPRTYRTTPLSFFVLAFAITWLAWMVPVLAGRGMFTLSSTMQIVWLLIGSFGPFMAAFVSTYRDGGWPHVREFFGRCLRYRIGPLYLIAALLLEPALGWITAWWLARHGGPPLGINVSLAHLPLLYAILFFGGGSCNEEFGWAYAIDRLQLTRPLALAAPVFGVIWGVWHLPLFYIPGTSQSVMPFWAFAILTTALRVIYVWAYEGAGKSILASLLFHTAANLCFNFYMLVDTSPRHDERGLIVFALLNVPVAVILLLTSRVYRRRTLA